MPTYLVFTPQYGILQKDADNIEAARYWAKTALGITARQVVRAVNGVDVAALEADYRAQLARLQQAGRVQQ